MKSIPRITLLLAPALLLFSCGSTPTILPKTQTIEYTTLTSTQDLKLDRSHAPTLLYRRPNAPLLGTYDRFITSDVRIRISNNAQTIPDKDIEFMAQYLKAAIRHELSSAGYAVGQGYAKEAVRMEFIISGLELIDDDTSIPTSTAPVASIAQDRSNGQWLNSLRMSSLIVEGVFMNAKAKRVDAVVVSTSEPRGFEDGQAWSNWEDVELSLDQWAKGIRAAVDRTSNGRPFPR